MPVFKIKQRDYDQMWVPDHPEIEYLTAYSDDGTPYEQMRSEMWNQVETLYPGVYTLEWTVPELRAERINQVNERTAAIIAAGFLYQSVRYSASLQAQALWLNVKVLPPASITINNIDDTADTTFTGAAVATFANAALGFVRGNLDSGTLIKRQLRTAATLEALQAIADPR